MKKKLFNLPVLVFSLLALASCDLKNENKNNDGRPVKGKEVDSITLNVNSDKLIISKNDSYSDVASKLTRTIAISHNEDNYHTFYEKMGTSSTREYTNYYFRDVKKEASGEVKTLDSYTTGNKKGVYSVNATTTMYELNGVNFFYKGNEYYRNNDVYDFKSGKTVVENGADLTNIGEYYNLDGSIDKAGSIEYAGNYLYNRLPVPTNLWDDNTKEIIEKNNNLYLNFSWEEGSNALSKAYHSEEYNVDFYPIFAVSRNFYTPTSSRNPYNYDSMFNMAVMSDGYMGNISEIFKKYYDYSFELTENYLILKNRLNTSQRMITMIEEENFSNDEIEGILKSSEGSYTYTEVWLDYKNLRTNNDKIQMDYVYCTTEEVECSQTIAKFESDKLYYDISNDELIALGLMGKEYKIYNKDEYSFETYIIDIKEEEISKKKKEFIDSCKEKELLTALGINEFNKNR